jgi:feruloyl esterase
MLPRSKAPAGPARSFRRWLSRIAVLVATACAAAGCTLGTGASREVQQLLTEVPDFAPGQEANLRMFTYVPPSAGTNAPLVVVLHHCFQTAPDYLEDSGWHTIADRYGLALLLPQQSVLNDITYCFSWSHETTQTRGQGESNAITLMVQRMLRDHAIDRTRIFITGLSSGGSMALVMMATHPDLFAGGGVIGAVPFGCATSGIQFPACLLGSDAPALSAPETLGDRVRAANPGYRGPWPRLSLWHGTEDQVSRPVNGELILQQWLNVHGIAPGSRQVTALGRFPRAQWRDAGGRVAIEYITLTGVGHSTPVDSRAGCGTGNDGVGNFISDLGICSSEVIAQFWGLRPRAAARLPSP